MYVHVVYKSCCSPRKEVTLMFGTILSFRRMKADVLDQLPEKTRKMVSLDDKCSYVCINEMQVVGHPS